MVTGSLDDLVKVWKWRDERLELQWSLEGHQLGVVSVDISHTLPIAASSSLDAHIRLWDLENGKQMKSIDAGPVDAWTLAFSPDSQYLATGTDGEGAGECQDVRTPDFEDRGPSQDAGAV